MAKWSNEKMADLTRKLADTAIEQNELYQAALRDAKEAESYAEELEAKLAKAVEALERIEDASKYFGNCPEASETTVRYAHETTRRLARTTLAELTGGNDE